MLVGHKQCSRCAEVANWPQLENVSKKLSYLNWHKPKSSGMNFCLWQGYLLNLFVKTNQPNQRNSKDHGRAFKI